MRELTHPAVPPAAETNPDLPGLLHAAKTIAVVGCSNRPGRTSHRIARYLRDAGFDVRPVNPFHSEVLGLTCYPSVDAIPDEVVVDVVDIFRRPKFTADVVRDALKRVSRLNRQPVIWTQIGVSSPEAKRLAVDNGLVYVANRCTMVEHARWTA